MEKIIVVVGNLSISEEDYLKLKREAEDAGLSGERVKSYIIDNKKESKSKDSSP